MLDQLYQYLCCKNRWFECIFLRKHELNRTSSIFKYFSVKKENQNKIKIFTSELGIKFWAIKEKWVVSQGNHCNAPWLMRKHISWKAKAQFYKFKMHFLPSAFNPQRNFIPHKLSFVLFRINWTSFFTSSWAFSFLKKQNFTFRIKDTEV